MLSAGSHRAPPVDVGLPGSPRVAEDFIACIAQRTDKVTVTHLCRISWRCPGDDRTRVAEHTDGPRSHDLKDTGTDEVPYRTRRHS